MLGVEYRRIDSWTLQSERMTERKALLYEFGAFRIDISQRLLTHNEEPLPITPKSFDALVLFVQNSGRLLEKEELMKTLWPESFVEEGNLSQNVFVLRKILGQDQTGASFIQTIPRRGYKFVAPVRQICSSSNRNGLPGNAHEVVEIRSVPRAPAHIGHAGLKVTVEFPVGISQEAAENVIASLMSSVTRACCKNVVTTIHEAASEAEAPIFKGFLRHD